MAFVATAEQPLPAHFLIFDLETVGPVSTPRACRIWELAVVHWASKRTFTATVDPGWPTYPPPPHPDLCAVTAAWLTAQGARPFAAVATDLRAFVTEVAGSTSIPVVWIAHGCSVFDKPVLEHEFARLEETMPSNWLFYDTLPFFRRVWRKHPQGYSLRALYTSAFGTPPPQHHRALADAMALMALLHRATGGYSSALVGVYYPPMLTPLQTVKFIGTHAERLLHAGGYTCVEDLLIALAKTHGLHVPELKRTLLLRCPLFNAGEAERIAASVLRTLLRRTVPAKDPA